MRRMQYNKGVIERRGYPIGSLSPHRHSTGNDGKNTETVIEKTPSGVPPEDLRRFMRKLTTGSLLQGPSIVISAIDLCLILVLRRETGREEDQRDDTDEAVAEKAICSKRSGRKTFYIFSGKKSDLLAGNKDVTMMLLGMYPQLRGAMKSSIEAAMESIFRQSLSGLCTFAGILSELEHVVHVSGAFPADLAKAKYDPGILRAIKERKRVRISYLRTYDGAITDREVEPHGLLCRLNNWYLTGLCTQRKQRRVFLLLNIRELTVIENSVYRMPPGFSLKEAYQDIWGNGPKMSPRAGNSAHHGLCRAGRALQT